MRLIETAVPNRNSISNYINGSIDILDDAELEKLGYDNLNYRGKLSDDNGNLVAYVFEKNGMFGAYGLDGKRCIPFVYEEYNGVTGINLSCNKSNIRSDLYYFMNADHEYEVYHGTKLVSNSTGGTVVGTSKPYCISDDGDDNFNLRYAIIERNGLKEVYDIDKHKFLNLILSSDIIYIHSEFERIIAKDSNDTYFIYDFLGNQLAQINEEIQFCKKAKDFYKTTKRGSKGLYALKYKKLVQVLSGVYSEVLDVTEYMAVTTTGMKTIVHQLNYDDVLNTFHVETYAELFSGDFIYIHLFENDGIVWLANDKKVLLSQYVANNKDKRYFCEDIKYIGNGIFKCFQVKDDMECDVTYIHCSQAVSYQDFQENVHVFTDKTNLIMFAENGKILYNDTDSTCFDVEDFFDENSMMNIGKEGFEYLWGVTDRTDTNYLIDFYAKEKHETNETENDGIFVWHYLYKNGDLVYDMKKRMTPFLHSKVFSTFNDFMVLMSTDDYYITDRDFNYIKIPNAKTDINRLYNYQVIENNDEAYLVSNNGIEHFTFESTIGKHKVYKSVMTGNFIVDFNYVTKKMMKDDLNKNIIDPMFSTFL